MEVALDSSVEGKYSSKSWLVGPRAGINTNWMLGQGFRFVGNAAATVITSSPGLILLSPLIFFEVNTEIANKLADDPEFVNKQYFVPINEAKSS